MFPGKEINVSRNRRTQNYFGWKVAMAIFGFILFIQGASQYNQLKRCREFLFLLLLTNPDNEHAMSAERLAGGTMGIRNSMVATSSDINPTTQGHGALDYEMVRWSDERRMVKRTRTFDSGKGAVA